MEIIRNIKGTKDILPQDSFIWQTLAARIHSFNQSFGYKEIKTPAFEESSLFERGIGSETDIVNKEMYSWIDQGGKSLTLRPELTAPVTRAYIQHELGKSNPINKLYYLDSLFRRERPQKGRQRQFHQIGIELVGTNSEIADTEVISCGNRLLKELNIEKNVVLQINSLGNIEDRKKYIENLLNYLNSYKNKLSKDSLNRIDKNPLRILDSKNEEDINILKNAPTISEYLNDDSKNKIKIIRQNLETLDISFTINPKLVRGLDYYNDLTFEFVTNELGSQGAVIAGGRYDGLMKQMGGPDLPGIGWAAGLERIRLLAKGSAAKNKLITIIPIGSKSEKFCLNLAEKIRLAKIQVNIGSSGNLKKRLQNANKQQSDYALIIGDEELEKNLVIVKNLFNGDQENISINDILRHLKNILN